MLVDTPTAAQPLNCSPRLCNRRCDIRVCQGTGKTTSSMPLNSAFKDPLKGQTPANERIRIAYIPPSKKSIMNLDTFEAAQSPCVVSSCTHLIHGRREPRVRVHPRLNACLALILTGLLRVRIGHLYPQRLDEYFVHHTRFRVRQLPRPPAPVPSCQQELCDHKTVSRLCKQRRKVARTVASGGSVM